VSGQFWDMGRVPSRNFDWLPFNPLWSSSPVLQLMDVILFLDEENVLNDEKIYFR
jgi:hypothetical protein